VAVELSDANLAAVSALGVGIPHYDRAALAPRIVHLGVGGFHRTHLARYVDELTEAGGDWAIRGAGLLEHDRIIAGVLADQDHLYTLVERNSDGSRPHVVGSIVDFVLGPDAFARAVADPEVAILSMTITEGGYSLERPNATIEAIVDALEARHANGGRPLTVLSCDNLPGNGTVAREAITRVATTRGAELLDYLESSCTFPNSMVDRITPQTTDEDRAWLRDEVGIEDGWPVVCEPFRQWVLEDAFAAGRPRLEDVGVLFTDRVHDWELYKLRMLNATHSCMAYLTAIADIVYVDEAIASPTVRAYLERFLRTEAIPTLARIPGHPAEEYAETVLDRFSNTGVRDQIARLCIDGTAKFPTFLIPTIERQLELDGPVDCAALALAGWARYLGTVPADVRAPDSHGARSVELAARALDDPRAFLELDAVFTPCLRESERFADVFVHAYGEVARGGSISAIRAIV
jgi:mannitol 2-dehydrogenase